MLLALASAVALLLPVPASHTGEPRPKAYWTAIVSSGYAVPEGEDPGALLVELSAHLSSRDPELRDDCGYGIAQRWILKDRRLSAADLRRLVALWSANLEVGIGESGTDSVLLRSFSALDLSLVAALDLEAPFLDQEEFDALLRAAVRYLESERDLRGWVPEVGWHHGCAHASDLLRFLARNPRLDLEDQSLLVFAVAGRASAPVETVFVHGEDDRMARALVSVIARADFDLDGFRAALEPLAAALAAGNAGPFDPVRHGAATNSRNLLRALYVRLATAGELEGEREAARQAVLRILTT